MIDFLYRHDYHATGRQTWKEYVDALPAVTHRDGDSISLAEPTSKGEVDDDCARTPDSPDKALILHTELYALGSKYAITHLQGHALQKFKKGVEKGCAINNIVDIVETVRTSTPENDVQLRNAVLDLVSQERYHLSDSTHFEHVFHRFPDFAWKIFKDVCHRCLTYQDCQWCGVSCINRCRKIDGYTQSGLTDVKGYIVFNSNSKSGKFLCQKCHKPAGQPKIVPLRSPRPRP